MSQQTSYKCDVTNEYISESDAIPVEVKEVTRNRDRSPNDELQVRDRTNRDVDHISREQLTGRGLIPSQYSFETLQIIVLDREVVGYRDRHEASITEVKTPTDEQREFLRSLTYLSE